MEKEIEQIEKEDGLAMELLKEIKHQNTTQRRVIYALIATIVLVVGGFLIYLYQYDFQGSIEQNGVYTLVDSSGNVISADISPEQAEKIMEIINDGKNTDSENEGQKETEN